MNVELAVLADAANVSNVIKSTRLEEYMRLAYKTAVYQDHWGDKICYMAYHDELPGCKAQGATWQEAIANLNDARRDYIATLLEDGDDVPLPEALNVPPPSWNLVSGPNTPKRLAETEQFALSI